MKSLILSIVVLGFTSVGFSAQPWANWQGCYNTIEWNGKPVAQPPPGLAELTIGKIEQSNSPWYLDGSTQKPIPSANLHLVQRYDPNGPAVYVLLVSAFLNQGSYSESSDQIHYEFAGTVISKDSSKAQLNLHEAIDLHRRADGLIMTHIFLDDGPNKVDSTYLIEAAPCPSSLGGR